MIYVRIRINKNWKKKCLDLVCEIMWVSWCQSFLVSPSLHNGLLHLSSILPLWKIMKCLLQGEFVYVKWIFLSYTSTWIYYIVCGIFSPGVLKLGFGRDLALGIWKWTHAYSKFFKREWPIFGSNFEQNEDFSKKKILKFDPKLTQI